MQEFISVLLTAGIVSGDRVDCLDLLAGDQGNNNEGELKALRAITHDLLDEVHPLVLFLSISSDAMQVIATGIEYSHQGEEDAQHQTHQDVHHKYYQLHVLGSVELVLGCEHVLQHVPALFFVRRPFHVPPSKVIEVIVRSGGIDSLASVSTRHQIVMAYPVDGLQHTLFVIGEVA